MQIKYIKLALVIGRWVTARCTRLIHPTRIILLLALSQTSFANTLQTYEYRLGNGLKLIVQEDHRAPVVISQIWYKVGSSYEPDGITGISHVLEHMMFKGTSKHPAGEFSRLISLNGGKENASTSNDYTFYYQELSADKLPLSFELEADRMNNLALLNSEFKKEIQVVISERNMRTDDNPQAHTYERFIATAFVSSPYHHLTIGWLDDLQHLNINDLNQWYKTWYAPNNAIVVVTGDVKPEAVYQLAKKYFGAIPPANITQIKPQREIKPLGEKRVIVKAEAQLPWIIMGYLVPTLVTAKEKWQPYAIAVLQGILDGGNAARLEKEIVRTQQIATDANASYDIYDRLDTLFTLDGTPAPGHTIDQLENAFKDQIKRLQTTLVTDEELKRVKAQVIANKLYAKDSLAGKASEIGSLESVGLSWRVANQYVDNIKMVTKEQIQKVAQLYFNSDNATIGILSPLPMAKSNVPALSPIGSQNVK